MAERRPVYGVVAGRIGEEGPAIGEVVGVDHDDPDHGQELESMQRVDGLRLHLAAVGARARQGLVLVRAPAPARRLQQAGGARVVAAGRGAARTSRQLAHVGQRRETAPRRTALHALGAGVRATSGRRTRPLLEDVGGALAQREGQEELVGERAAHSARPLLEVEQGGARDQRGHEHQEGACGMGGAD